MTITKVNVYQHEDMPKFSDEDMGSLALVMHTVLSFVSRNRMRDIVEQLAFYDDFGYKNLRNWYNTLEKINSTTGMGGKAAIHYNLRHFTLINQEIGRISGDKAMRIHYDTLSNRLGNKGGVFRLGGDNFVCYCDLDILDDVLDYLTEASVIYDTENGGMVKISTSMGVFIMPEGYVTDDAKEITGKIITASRIAQNGGHEHIIYYDESLVLDREKSMRVQKLFPDALRNNEFHVFYQPKVNIKTGDIYGAEALCRWIKDGRIIPPIDFIPALEETADICRLDFHMLDKVCMDIRRWLDEGRNPVRVSVNLSRKHIMDSNLLDNIIKIIDRNKVPHEYIEIELTETTTDVEFQDLKRVVGGLRTAGIHASVDDFGMGYSSLNLIRVVPWDVLKIDKSFLPMEEDQRDSVRGIMFRHVVEMAQELGLECIAEGVETSRQLNVLRDNNCSLAQGYFFDKPLPVEEFEKRLNDGKYQVNA